MRLIAMLTMLMLPSLCLALTLEPGTIIQPNSSSSTGYYILQTPDNSPISLDELIVDEYAYLYSSEDKKARNVDTDEVLAEGKNISLAPTNSIINLEISILQSGQTGISDGGGSEGGGSEGAEPSAPPQQPTQATIQTQEGEEQEQVVQQRVKQATLFMVSAGIGYLLFSELKKKQKKKRRIIEI